MSRRSFLRAAGGIAAAAALGQACRFAGIAASTEGVPPTPFQPASPSATEVNPAATATAVPASPVPTPESLVGRVALIRTADRAEGTRRAVDLLGINPVANKSVFIKPNFNSAHPAPGSTHDDILRTLLAQLRRRGAAARPTADPVG